MWQILNTTDYACAGTFLRDAGGHEHWCVAIRATFERQPDGLLRPAAEQIPVNMAPRHAGKDHEILLADDDFIPFAPVTDILIRGEARPASADPRPIPLTIEIGSLRKQAMLHPPRMARLSRGAWRLAETAAQQPSPLGWEVSFGGTLPDAADDLPPENPLGTGLALRAPRLFADGTRIALPRIEGIGMDCLRDPQGARSIGFAPVPRWWRDRVTLAGQFDDSWRRDHAPAMPADYDPHFLCSAPRDQWPATHLIGGEPVLMRGFTGAEDWQFRLPQALFRIETRLGAQLMPLPARLARIDLWPADNLISMLWLGTLACNGRDHLIEVSRVSLRQLAGVAP